MKSVLISDEDHPTGGGGQYKICSPARILQPEKSKTPSPLLPLPTEKAIPSLFPHKII